MTIDQLRAIENRIGPLIRRIRVRRSADIWYCRLCNRKLATKRVDQGAIAVPSLLEHYELEHYEIKKR